MHPVNPHDLARALDADRRRAQAHRDREPRRRAATVLREAVGYRLVVTGWRLLDHGAIGATGRGGVIAAAAPPGRTAGPRPA
jgi:hypothetical protein